MRISILEIEKFRSIQKTTIRLDRINGIVGENNSGKTAILRALNSFFNFEEESELFRSQKHRYASKTNTYITVHFIEVPQRSIYSSLVNDGVMKVKMQYIYTENRRVLYYYPNGSQTNADETFIDEIKKDINYVYVPSNRSIQDITWNSKSIFAKLVNEFAHNYTASRDNVSAEVKRVGNRLHDKILAKIERQLNDLYMQQSAINFKIDYRDEIDYAVFLNKLELSIDDYRTYSLRDCGSGTRSLSVIAMYRAYAKLINTDIILGIEEPETNLHPQAQKGFILSLKESMSSTEVQTIFTTHSTVLVDELRHEDIILVRRVSDERRGFKSIITQLQVDFWSRYDIVDFQHYQFFNYRNSDFFFAKYVILAESKTDEQVIHKLINPSRKKQMTEVSILNLDGITNIKYPFFLLKELNIPFSMVVDKDFFVPYQNNNQLDVSRDQNTGLPNYASSLKSDNPVVNHLFPTQQLKNTLLLKLNGGYRDLFDYLKQYNLYTMRYCLEMDLTCSSKARQHFYSIFQMTLSDQTQQKLLVEKHKSIKNIKNILDVLNNIPATSYPESYSKIKNALIHDIDNFT